MSEFQLSVAIVHTINLTLLQARHEIDGIINFLIDDVVVQPLHAQIGGHICHKDKFRNDDREVPIVHDDVRRLKFTKCNEGFYHFADGFARHPS